MIGTVTEAFNNRRERPIRSAPGVSGGHIFRSDLIPETGDAESDTPNCKLIEQHIVGPEPTSGRGQFIYIAAGAAKYDGQRREAGTAIFIAPNDPAATLTTDTSGAEILVMQFPKANS